MPDEIIFSKGVRGKFYKPYSTCRCIWKRKYRRTFPPLHQKMDVDLSNLVNALLKKDIELIEAGS